MVSTTSISKLDSLLKATCKQLPPLTNLTPQTTVVTGNGKIRFSCQATKDYKVFENLPLLVSDSHVPPLLTLHPNLFPKEIYPIIDQYLKSSVNLTLWRYAFSEKAGLGMKWSFFADFHARAMETFRSASLSIPPHKLENIPETTVFALRKKPDDTTVFLPPLFLKFENTPDDHSRSPFHIFAAIEGEKGVPPLLCTNPLQLGADRFLKKTNIHHLLFLPNPHEMKKFDPEAKCIALVHLVEHWEESEKNGSAASTLSPEQLHAYQKLLVSSLPLTRQIVSISQGILVNGLAPQKK